MVLIYFLVTLFLVVFFDGRHNAIISFQAQPPLWKVLIKELENQDI